MQTSTINAATEYAPSISTDPTATTAARRTAIALAGATNRIATAERHLLAVFTVAMSANVWAIPSSEDARPADHYHEIFAQLASSARELRATAEQLPTSGQSQHSQTASRANAARSFTGRLRSAFQRRPAAEPLPVAALPRTAAKPRR
ncbi:hypothetical protein [Streptomyces sp. CBMA123]|uniref:hypothetical protein n=1 Tax=Streptomyces sp. CBMA123 TaxID=1896313 RepID=UPI001661DBC1|nr:hypothetical protein [Streptomyces sp. CBMA123]MBD0688305.1 hypothetical protein [Streptomyces sp. CBMA123]